LTSEKNVDEERRERKSKIKSEMGCPKIISG
jgi:hypothetical protein